MHADLPNKSSDKVSFVCQIWTKSKKAHQFFVKFASIKIHKIHADIRVVTWVQTDYSAMWFSQALCTDANVPKNGRDMMGKKGDRTGQRKLTP